MKKRLFAFIFFFLLSGAATSPASAQETTQDTRELYRARVLRILNEETVTVQGTDIQNISQEILVQILDKDKEGERAQFTNDYIELDEGDVIFINHHEAADGADIYSVAEPDRRGALAILTTSFVAIFLVFAGWRGLRPLLSLVGVFVVIFFFLVPMLLSGAPPVLTSILFSVVIMALVMYVTHGFTPSTTAAFLGTTTTLAITSVLAQIAVSITDLSGFGSDEAIYLNINTEGALNLSGILLGSIIIGAIGVLDDIAITQTALTGELKLANPSLSRRELFKRAMRVGREHISALVNTLALAYAGASLPLLLLFSLSDLSPLLLVNKEIFAVEVVRTLVGSIGLILAVPLTTWFTLMLIDKKDATMESHAHHH